MKKKKARKLQKRTAASDYDSAWKDVIEYLTEPLLQFFFPEAHADIDFSKGVGFLTNELRRIVPVSKIGKRFADELIKVYLKDGSVKFLRIFIHIEVQGKKEKNLEERVFIYYYRTFDRYKEEGVEVISLVILTDEDENYRPDEYHVSRWGFDLRMKIPTVKIIDFRNNSELRRKLEESSNPIALIVKAQLKSCEVKKDSNEKKSTVKWELIRQCYESGYSKNEIEILLKFIDWLILLPESFQEKLNTEILKLEEEYKMGYVTSWEKMAQKRGEEIGEERGERRGERRGEKRGEKKGKLETARELVKRGIDINIIAEATGFPLEEIEKLAVDVQ
jgi:hypothetical protein